MTKHNIPGRRRGVTLVELMVALAISFILVGAAAYLYLSTRESQRAVDETASANDTGMFVMQVIGRELMTAGFFPTRWNQEGNFALAKYDYIKQVPNATAYQFGIFGCEGKRFDPATGTCTEEKGTKADSVVFSYFTLDPGRVGQREDCQGTDVANDEVHNPPATIWGESGKPGNPNATPASPMLVANAFHLNETTVQVDGRKVGTRSFSCFGNGNDKNKAYQPIVSGVEDLQITYGLAAIGTTETLSPEKFVDADAVGANWGRVVAVRVCVLVHSLAGGTKLAQQSTGARSYVDCNGTTVKQAGADASTIYKTYVQTFGVRNHQTGTY